jgi:hypothetical protein
MRARLGAAEKGFSCNHNGFHRRLVVLLYISDGGTAGLAAAASASAIRSASTKPACGGGGTWSAARAVDETSFWNIQDSNPVQLDII